MSADGSAGIGQDTATTCPCCGQPVRRPGEVLVWGDMQAIERRGRVVKLTPREFAVFSGIWQAWPRSVERDALYDALYANRRRSRPGSKIIEVTICKVRKKLAPLGLLVTAQWGVGYVLTIGESAAMPALMREAVTAAGRKLFRWKDVHDRQVRALWARGERSPTAIGAAMQAPYAAVERSIKRLGLK